MKAGTVTRRNHALGFEGALVTFCNKPCCRPLALPMIHAIQSSCPKTVCLISCLPAFLIVPHQLVFHQPSLELEDAGFVVN